MRRVLTRDQLEIYEKLHIQKQVSAAYERVLADAERKGWNVAVIDAEKSVDDVTRQILCALEERLGLKIGARQA
jgi:thymidylate kinase